MSDVDELLRGRPTPPTGRGARLLVALDVCLAQWGAAPVGRRVPSVEVTDTCGGCGVTVADLAGQPSGRSEMRIVPKARTTEAADGVWRDQRAAARSVETSWIIGCS